MAVSVVVLIVRVLVPEPGALKLAEESLVVIPPGWPETESVTFELNPLVTLTVRPTVVLDPCATVTDPVVPVSVKPRPGPTVTVNVAFCVTPPPNAVSCTG